MVSVENVLSGRPRAVLSVSVLFGMDDLGSERDAFGTLCALCLERKKAGRLGSRLALVLWDAGASDWICAGRRPGSGRSLHVPADHWRNTVCDMGCRFED